MHTTHFDDCGCKTTELQALRARIETIKIGLLHTKETVSKINPVQLYELTTIKEYKDAKRAMELNAKDALISIDGLIKVLNKRKVT